MSKHSARPRSRPLAPSAEPPSPPATAHPSPPHDLSTETARRLNEQLKELRLPTFREHYQSLADQAVRESLSHRQYLAELVGRECQTRNHSRIQRLMRNSRLLHGKTWE